MAGNTSTGAPVAEQHTIDIARGRTMQERLTDPIVISLGALLAVALIVILVLTIKG
jgi:hypothetical protein